MKLPTSGLIGALACADGRRCEARQELGGLLRHVIVDHRGHHRSFVFRLRLRGMLAKRSKRLLDRVAYFGTSRSIRLARIRRFQARPPGISDASSRSRC